MTSEADPGASRLGPGLLLAVFLPLAGGYFLSFLYRSINAMIAPQNNSIIKPPAMPNPPPHIM